MSDDDKPARSVLGVPLKPCGTEPLTGFYRDGCCNTGAQDVGMHTVCAQMTEAFLAYTQAKGNDLSTPRPELGFPGLKPGDRWCLCAARWKEALDDGVAPPIFLSSTHERTLAIVSLEELSPHALDVN